MNRSTKHLFTLILITSVVAACASQDPVNSRLDSSGLTVVALDEVIVLARSAPQLSTAARDYVYLGPVEINRMGELNHFVWVGMASTVDRTLAGQPLPKAASLALLVDGMPMELPLTSWETELDTPPYQSKVPVSESFAARASLDQINRIAMATSVEVHIITETGASARYEKWQGEWPDWSAFSAQGSAAEDSDTFARK